MILLLMLFVLAPLGAADAISRERREGTLGLLLLTRLTPRQVVLGKLSAHFVTVLYAALLMLPFLMLPVWLGGVGFADFLLSAVILISVAAVGLGSGLFASAIFLNFGTALWCALFLNFFIACLLSSAVLNVLFSIFPARLPNQMSAALKWFFLGPGLLVFPLQARDLMSMFIPTPWFLPTSEVGLFVLATIILVLSIAYSTRKVDQHREFAGETKRQAMFRRKFLTPIVWRGAFRRRMSRSLDRNPFIWLEFRTAWARAAHSALVLLVIAVETRMFLELPSQDQFIGIQLLLLMLVVTFMTFKSSSSFHNEKETGAFELILVTPLTEENLVFGRIRAVASYYASGVLAVALLGICGIYWLKPQALQESALSYAVNFTTLCGSLLSVPFCGLFFALRSRTYASALLWSAGTAVLAPICLWFAFSGLLWMAVRQQWPGAVMFNDNIAVHWWTVAVAITVYHVTAALLGGRAAIRLLRQREFHAFG